MHADYTPAFLNLNPMRQRYLDLEDKPRTDTGQPDTLDIEIQYRISEVPEYVKPGRVLQLQETTQSQYPDLVFL